MRIAQFLTRDAILADMKSTEKNEALAELITPFLAAFPRMDRGKVLAILGERERLGSTAMDHGVAIPHGKIPDLAEPVLVVGRSLKGIAFSGQPGQLSHLFFLVLAPEGAAGQHLGFLGVLARLLKDEAFRTRLLQAADADDLWRLLAVL